MIARPLWTERLVAGSKQASIVWLTGPRRVGYERSQGGHKLAFVSPVELRRMIG